MKEFKSLMPYTIRVDGKVVWGGEKGESEAAFDKEVEKNYDRIVTLVNFRKVLKTHEPETESKKVKKIVEGKGDVPNVYDVVERLEDARYQLEADGDVDETDIRLQVADGYWDVHVGDASYDTDHHGYWGASMVSIHDDEDLLFSIAEDLINEVLDDMAEVSVAS